MSLEKDIKIMFGTMAQRPIHKNIKIINFRNWGFFYKN